MDLGNLSLSDWIDVLASERAVPAAVSLAAVSGAGAAALAAKIEGVAARRRPARHRQRRDEHLAAELKSLSRALLAQGARDVDAYRRWMTEKTPSAARGVVSVPEQVESLCTAALGLCSRIRIDSRDPAFVDLEGARQLLSLGQSTCQRIASANRRAFSEGFERAAGDT
jgi:hypothetical protein